MLVVTAFHPGDLEQAIRVYGWIYELGGARGHDVLFIADSRCSPPGVDRLTNLAKASFNSVNVLQFTDHFQRWPDACNAAFAFAARHNMAGPRVPWLFMEPDCIPLRSEWLNTIAKEYGECGKPFMGARVDVDGVPLHLSGNAVYPADMFQHGGNALIAGDIAWDVAAASQIVPQAHFTKLIVHAWKHPAFNDQGEVDNLLSQHPEALLFHADKSGSLIRLLRERKNNLGGTPARSLSGGFQPKNEAGSAAQFICDILIKSYPPDYERLRYCVRSIEKFATGFRRLIVVVPEGDAVMAVTDFFPKVTDGKMRNASGVLVCGREETGEPYLFQNSIKASAHQYTDADYVLHIDSDCILTKPITPATFFRDGKVVWMMTPYSSIQAGIEAQKAADPNFHCGALTWKLVTEKFLGEPVAFEFMRRMPVMVPRALHVAAAEFCKIKHGVSLTDYILSQPAKEFSEFNSLGALAYSRARDDFYWLDTTKEPLPETVCIQEWSHAPFTAERRTEFELILSEKGGDASCLNAPAACQTDQPEVRSNPGSVPSIESSSPAPTSEPERAGNPPWQSSEQSVAEIKSLAERLQVFCTGGAKTRIVREELHRLGVVQLPYRMKKRKGWRKRKAKA